MKDRISISTRQLMLVVIVLLVGAVVVVPVSAGAGATDPVRIADAKNSSRQARVTQSGRLVIGDGSGPLTVDGSVDLSGPVEIAGEVTLGDPIEVAPTALAPIQRALQISMAPGDFEECGKIFSVPADKRLLIEFLSARGTAGGNNYLDGLVRTTVEGFVVDHYMGFQLPVANRLIAAQDVSVYADPGTDVTVCTSRAPLDTNSEALLTTSISGRLLDAP